MVSNVDASQSVGQATSQLNVVVLNEEPAFGLMEEEAEETKAAEEEERKQTSHQAKQYAPVEPKASTKAVQTESTEPTFELQMEKYLTLQEFKVKGYVEIIVTKGNKYTLVVKAKRSITDVNPKVANPGFWLTEMKACQCLNKDNATVYGVLTTLHTWSLVKLDFTGLLVSLTALACVSDIFKMMTKLYL